MDDKSLFLRLAKIIGEISNEVLDDILQTLWSTRKIGLKSQQKSHIRNLLGLPSSEELDPVLACLRVLIRKCIRDGLSEDDICKLFPSEVPLQLQNDLVLLLQKYQGQWKKDDSNDQPHWPKMRVSYQVKVNSACPHVFSSLPNAEVPQIWPRQDDTGSSLSHDNLDGPTIQVAIENQPFVAPIEQDDLPPDKLVSIPYLKSMTWTIENQKSNQSTRVAIITLKLQDYTKSPSGEREVKFQVSKDTLDAMLRSMRYISEKMANATGSPTEQALKKRCQ